MATFKKVTFDEAEELSLLASRVVKEHYDPILGAEQNDYMIEKFQSVHAITEQLKEGYRYYLMEEDGTDAGFCGFYPRDGKMYLSKFYIAKEFRGRYLAREMFNFIVEKAREDGKTAVFLNVNRFNDHSIDVYKHLGFKKIREEKIDIGSGYYMDDFVMEYDF